MMTKQTFRSDHKRIRIIAFIIWDYDNKLGGMNMTEFEPSKLGTRAQYVRQFTLKN
jgi:hypothetical protein